MITDSMLLISCEDLFLSLVATRTDYSFDEIDFHDQGVFCTHITARSNFQPYKVATKYFDSGIFVCAHLKLLVNRSILPNIYLGVPIYEKNYFARQ